jgi:hypothetical protein
MGKKRNAYKISLGKPEGKGPLGRPRRRWEDSTRIKMDLIEVVWGGLDWIYLAQDRGPVEGCCEHGNEPSGFQKML